jgi:GSH-dependent disulfide-bond oxidoreductase
VIDLYTWPTPNGIKIHIMLEETGLPYRVHGIDITTGAQFDPEFLKVSPNNKIPAILDAEGPEGRPFALFESGVILVYLAEKARSPLLSTRPERRYQTLQWLMFQMAGVGPMLGQANFFRKYCPVEVPYALERYTREAGRLYKVMDRHLAGHEYLADDYSIADIAVWPWIVPYFQGVELTDFSHLNRWFHTIAARPAVARGNAVLADRQTPAAEIKMDAAAKDLLYGSGQYDR